MKTYLYIFLLSFPALALSQGPVDGYSKGKGNLDAGLGYTYEKGTEFYAGKNHIDLSRTLNCYSFFALYGITDKVDVQINIPYMNMNKGNENDFQDGSIYLKYKAIRKANMLGDFNLFGALGYYHPLAVYQTGGGSAIGQQNRSLDTRLILQQNFKRGCFISLQGGYFVKSVPTPNAYSSSLKIGYATSKIYADLWLENQHAIGGTDYRGIGDLAPNAATGGFRGLGYSFSRIGGTVFYPIKERLGAYLGGAYTLAGRNVSKGTRISAGVVFKVLRSNKF